MRGVFDISFNLPPFYIHPATWIDLHFHIVKFSVLFHDDHCNYDENIMMMIGYP